MTVFDRIREKNKIISFIVKLQNTALYPALIAIICAISGTGNKDIYIPCVWIITALAVFGGLFSPDLKVFIVPAFLGYYAIGIDDPKGYFNTMESLPLFDMSSAWHFAACVIIIVAVLVYRLISDGMIKDMLFKRGVFFWGIIFLDLAIILGGFLSPQWTLSSFLFGLMVAGVLTVFYPLFLNIFARSKNAITYTCKTLIFTGFAIVAQISIIAYRLNLDGKLIYDLGNGNYFLHRGALTLSWGFATLVGAVLVLSICAAMYLMRSRKYPALSLISAFILWVATILIDTRSAIFFGGIALVAGCILCCIGGKNRVANRITSMAIVLLLLLSVLYVVLKYPDSYREHLHSLLKFLRLEVDFDTMADVNSFFSSRITIWIDALKDFFTAPLFGVGFAYGYFTPETASGNLFINMYHNIILQFLASLGFLGLFAFLIHLKQMAEVMFRRFTVKKLLVMLVPFCILGMSLVDNFFFYPNFTIVYAAFIAAAEVLLEESRQDRLNNLKVPDKTRKPRVVFTYVEAGKGHIIPTKTVCEEFRKSYGDRCEIVESKFFTETGDPKLEKTEILFRRAVKNQNRSPLLSFLCKIGNLIAGDVFALQVLLKMSISGRKTNPRAVKHIEELDADVLYSAHWSTPFYVNQLKSPRPYVICFCPDVYSNGAFNVDCNNFLISSDVGYRQVLRSRMYAGGNITKIPFPMRPESEEYKDEAKKAECRAKLGIPADEFVVVLCDGGYGMAKLEKTVNALLKSSQPMTVIAMCGMNKQLYQKLSKLQNNTPKHIRLIAVDFTDNVLEYIACANVFAGKSGANSVAEPAALGVPIIVTKCITYIEKGIKNYYVRQLKGALYIPSAHLAAIQIERFAKNPTLLEPMKRNLASSERQTYDAKASADIIWKSVCDMYGYEG